MGPSDPVGLIVLTACWKRPELTALVTSYYADLQIPGLALHPVAAVSEGESFSGWDTIHAPNSPLGAKWNAALAYAEELDGERGWNSVGVVIVGSDDILNLALFTWLAKYYDTADFIELADCYFYDLVTSRVLWLYRGRIGAGRFISRDLLDKCAWKLWNPDAERGLDHGTNQILGKCEHALYRGGAAALDIKTADCNIWSFDHLRDNVRSEDSDAATLQSLFGEEVMRSVKRLAIRQFAKRLA